MPKKTGQIAQDYDRFSSLQQHIWAQLVSRSEIDAQTTSLLDLGCGTGLGAAQLAQIYPTLRVQGVDRSEPYISYAKHHYGGLPQVSFSVANLDSLVLTETYDRILSGSVLQWIHAPETLFSTVSQALTSGGLFSVAIFGPNTYCELSQIWQSMMPATDSVVAATFRTPSDWTGLMSGYFSDIFCEQELIQIPYPDLKTCLTTIQKTGTVGQGLPHKQSWTPRFFKAFETAYRDTFGEIIATHQIIYIKAKR